MIELADVYQVVDKRKRPSQPKPQGITDSIKGKTEGTVVTQEAGTYSKLSASGFNSPDAVISDSFSLDTGKRSRPSRTSLISLSIKSEKVFSLNRR